MSIQQINEKKKPDANRTNVDTTPVATTIRTKKDAYCDSLVSLVGTLTAAEENVNGLTTNYEFKKCCFVKTEKNYRITRNLELQTGVELIQSSAEIKADVTDLLTKNGKLVDALKAVCVAAKDAKSKFSDLRDAASKLDACRKDSCNASQMIRLGCRPASDCTDTAKNQDTKQGPLPAACENACCILDHLVTIPSVFCQDIDIIYTASADIKGIQTFTSIGSLQKFQLDFEANAKAFDDLVVQKMKDGKTAVDGAQSDLVDITKALTNASFALYNARNAVEAIDTIKDYLCCHKCTCISEDGECGCHHLDESNDRLKACKCEICDICDEVTNVYCKPPSKDCAD